MGFEASTSSFRKCIKVPVIVPSWPFWGLGGWRAEGQNGASCGKSSVVLDVLVLVALLWWLMTTKYSPILGTSLMFYITPRCILNTINTEILYNFYLEIEANLRFDQKFGRGRSHSQALHVVNHSPSLLHVQRCFFLGGMDGCCWDGSLGLEGSPILHPGKPTWQWKNNRLKIYLLKKGDFPLPCQFSGVWEVWMMDMMGSLSQLETCGMRNIW